MFQFWAIAMCSPDHDSGETGCSRLQRRQIADAAFIGAAVVIDDKDVALFGRLHCFEKNVNASEVFRRQHVTGETASGNDGMNSERRDLQWDAQTKSCVRD